jgi:Flp pilus assembly protein TadD
LIGVLLAVAAAQDKSVHINLPKRSRATPVQKLNREGVQAIEKHQYERARRLIYQAYLLDPDDPFTLNNMGYIAELEGDIERAGRYYDLAQQQESDAAVDLATSPELTGKPVSKVAGNTAETGMRLSRINTAAVSLLTKDRAPEADLLLQQGLQLDPRNPFTLNNLGYAKEKEGEFEDALNYYGAAAALNARDPVVVSVNKAWRGRAISDVAAENARKVRKELQKSATPAARLARLNLQGVSAMNRNDRTAARKYFEEAYQLDPGDAFTLNNMGFLAELDGDRETADFYYEKAREAKRRDATVTVATHADAEGKKVSQVAQNNDQATQAKIEQEQQQRREQGGPIELRRRPESPDPAPSAVPPAAPPQQ